MPSDSSAPTSMLAVYGFTSTPTRASEANRSFMEAHVLERIDRKHADQHFIFDDEDTGRSRKLVCHG
jgi:hypothetical protein